MGVAGGSGLLGLYPGVEFVLYPCELLCEDIWRDLRQTLWNRVQGLRNLNLESEFKIITDIAFHMHAHPVCDHARTHVHTHKYTLTYT